MDVEQSMKPTGQPAFAAEQTADRRFSRLHLIILLAMLTVVGMLAWTTWSARALVITFVPQVNAAMQARVSATEAHLWLEEIVSGDLSEDPQQVWDKIAEADAYMAVILDGGEKNGQIFHAVDDAVLRADLQGAQQTLAHFNELAHTRVSAAQAAMVAEKETVAVVAISTPEQVVIADDPSAGAGTTAAIDAGFKVGSDIDSQFDDTFAAFFNATQRVEERLDLIIENALHAFVVTQLLLMLAVAGVFAWILWLLIRKEAMDRDQHYNDLKASFEQLTHSQHELERQNALRGAMVELGDAMQGKNNPAQVAQVAIDTLCARTGASVAVCWLNRPGEGLARIAARALPAERQALQTIDEGEGMVGRAAIEQQLIAVDVPSDFLPVSSGLGTAPAPHLRVLPLVHDRQTVGVMELAFITMPDAYVSGLLAVAAPAIAVRLQMVNVTAELR